jgi:hypothetical protein
MTKYDPKDYIANPAKYSLFKTATLNKELIHENGSTKPGQIVSLEFLGDVWNHLYRRHEPLYRLNTGDTVFAGALGGFVL